MSVSQTFIIISILVSLTLLAVLGDIAGSVAAPILTAALAGTLGYMGGKNRRNGHPDS